MSSKAFLLVSKSPLICIERYLAFTAFFKIFGSTKPGFIFLLIDRDLRVNQLIGEVINAQDRKHSVHDDLIDAFMADDTVPRVIIAMSFVAGQTGVRGQQLVLRLRPQLPGGCAGRRGISGKPDGMRAQPPLFRH